jgi:hypothetical protein
MAVSLQSTGWQVRCVALVWIGVLVTSMAPRGHAALVDGARSDPHLVVKLRPSDGAADDHCGTSIAADGNLAVIGAPGADPAAGPVHVYRFNGFDWQREARLVPSAATADALFGTSVAVSGDAIAVGAPLQDGSGAVYVYRFDYGGGGWVEEALLTLPDSVNGDGFGTAVALDQHTLLVGALCRGDSGPCAGAAYVYRFDGDTWQPDPAPLLPAPGSDDHRFGAAVALRGNVALIGAPGEYGALPGSAHVFRFDGEDWLLEADLAGWSGASGDGFGHAVALDADYAFVGAPNHNATGGVYVYAYDAGSGNWVDDFRVLPSDGAADDSFGVCLAQAGAILMIGAPGHDAPMADSGAMYAFERVAGGWNELHQISDPGAYQDDQFGLAVALRGDSAFIGAPFDDNVGLDAGAVYVFDQLQPAITIATWTAGGGADHSYSNVANWNIDEIPINTADAQFSVVIPADMHVEFDLDEPGSVVDLTLAENATLTINPGSQLTALDDAELAGTVSNDNGVFNATSLGAALAGNQAKIHAAGNANCATVIAAATYDTRGLTSGGVLLRASGAGCLLNLPSLSTIDAGYTDSGTRTQWIEALGGGVVSMPSLTHITGPAAASCSLRLAADGDGIDMPVLATIAPPPSGGGMTWFDFDGSNVTIPALTSASYVGFELTAGSSWLLHELRHLDHATAHVPPGAIFETTRLIDLSDSTIAMPYFARDDDDRGNDTRDPARWDALQLLTMTRVDLDLADGCEINAPLLTHFVDSSVTLTPSRVFTAGTGTLINIDNSRLAVVNTTFGTDTIAAETYSSAGLSGNVTLFSATTGGTLDLSSIVDFDASGTTNGTQRVEAVGGGVVNLSGVTNVTSSTDDHFLVFHVGAESDINLDALTTIASGGSGTTYFEIEATDYTLPALVSASGTVFDLLANDAALTLDSLESLSDSTFLLSEGSTLNIPSVVSHEAAPDAGATLMLATDATVNADSLATLSGVELALAAGSAFNAPNLDTFTHGKVEVRPDNTFGVHATHGLQNIDNSEIWVRGDEVIFGTANGQVTATTFSTADQVTSGKTYFYADGADAVLDLSSLTQIDATFYGRGTNYITAVNGGLVGLPNVQSVTGPLGSNDRLRFSINPESHIDLLSLQTVSADSGRVVFDCNVPEYTLPQLDYANRVDVQTIVDGVVNLPALREAYACNFNLATGATLNMPSLVEVDSATTYSFSDGCTVYAPNCDVHNYNYSTDFTAPEDATLTFGWMTLAGDRVQYGSYGSTRQEVESLEVTLRHGSTLNLPALREYRYGDVAIYGDRRFSSGPIENIDNTRIQVRAGGQWGVLFGNLIGTTYSATGLWRWHTELSWNGDFYLFYADEEGILDLSSFTFVDSGFTENYNGDCGDDRNRHFIGAEDDGYIDLSGVEWIRGPRNYNTVSGREDFLQIFARNRGMISLASLQQITRVGGDTITYFDVQTGGALLLGSVTEMHGADFSITGTDSELGINGHFYLSSSSEFTAGAGSNIRIGGDWAYWVTDEDKCAMQAANLFMASGGTQRLEIGGTDCGVEPCDGDNFGIGRLIIGAPGQPTTVELFDDVDNGNRNGDVREALYLYGYGGGDGLELSEGSVLHLHGLHAYANIAGDWVHLNTLFGPGATETPFCDGLLRRDPPDEVPGDLNGDERVDEEDLNLFCAWMTGPGVPYVVGHGAADFDADSDIDLHDFSNLQQLLQLGDRSERPAAILDAGGDEAHGYPGRVQ